MCAMDKSDMIKFENDFPSFDTAIINKCVDMKKNLWEIS